MRPVMPGVKPEVEARLARALESIGRLPVLDGTARAVRELADDPHGSTDELVAVIERDEAFATNLLRTRTRRRWRAIVRAQTIRQAVTMVGRRQLALLALEAETYRFLERAPGQGRVSRGQMHVHAVTVAGSAAAARRAGAAVEIAHLAGLLHDIGKLVMPVAFGEETLEAIAVARAGRASARAQLERDELGVDHAYAGALLAGRPSPPTRSSRRSPGTTAACPARRRPTREAACVQVANSISDLLAGVPPTTRCCTSRSSASGSRSSARRSALESRGDDAARPRARSPSASRRSSASPRPTS